MAAGRLVSQYYDAHHASDVFDHYAMSGYEAKGETRLNTPKHVNMAFRQPIRPVAAIVPWSVTTSREGEIKCVRMVRNIPTIQDTIAEKIKAAFLANFRAAKKGDLLLPETAQGPQASKIQFDRIRSYSEAAKNSTAKLEVGGEAPQVEGESYFIYVPEDDKTQVEEVFDSFVNINTFYTGHEAIEKANSTEYGLIASIYTEDLASVKGV